MCNRPAADLFYGILDERVLKAVQTLTYDDIGAVLKDTGCTTITVGYYNETTALVLDDDTCQVNVYADIAELNLDSELKQLGWRKQEIEDSFRKALAAIGVEADIKPQWYLAASSN